MDLFPTWFIIHKAEYAVEIIAYNKKYFACHFQNSFLKLSVDVNWAIADTLIPLNIKFGVNIYMSII